MPKRGESGVSALREAIFCEMKRMDGKKFCRSVLVDEIVNTTLMEIATHQILSLQRLAVDCENINL
jgi:hypothetical protein